MDNSGVVTQSPSAGQVGYPVKLVGRARTFASRLPLEAFTDLSNNSSTRVYMYCWIDSERGQGARVNYVSPDIAGSCGSSFPVGRGLKADNVKGRGQLAHEGEFSMTIHVRDNDPDLLKIMGCIRMKDDESDNTRTATLASSAVQLDRLLMGEEQYHTMYSQFDPGNYTEFVIRAVNAGDYANSDHGAQTSHPFIKLSPSSLWNIDVFQEAASGVSESMEAKRKMFRINPPNGLEALLEGETRCVKSHPPLPSCMLFLSLLLGTPAYALAPFLASPAGKWEEQRSNREPLP